MSKYADQVIEVIKILKEDILLRLDNGEKVSEDDIRKLTCTAFKACAVTFGVNESTVRAKCCRRTKLKASEFYDLVKDYITQQGKQLEDVVVKHKTKLDSELQIRTALQNIRN